MGLSDDTKPPPQASGVEFLNGEFQQAPTVTMPPQFWRDLRLAKKHLGTAHPTRLYLERIANGDLVVVRYDRVFGDGGVHSGAQMNSQRTIDLKKPR